MPLRPELAILLVLAACSQAADLAADPNRGRPKAGAPLRVEILDPWFVRVDGEREAREAFLYRLRVQVRGWRAEGLAPPDLRLVFPSDPALGRGVSGFVRQLQLAGVGMVKIEAPEGGA